jgi:hypothetical protein
MKFFDIIAAVLLVVGGLNWGLWVGSVDSAALERPPGDRVSWSSLRPGARRDRFSLDARSRRARSFRRP